MLKSMPRSIAMQDFDTLQLALLQKKHTFQCLFCLIWFFTSHQQSFQFPVYNYVKVTGVWNVGQGQKVKVHVPEYFQEKRYARFDTDADTHINILKDFKNTLPA